MFAPFIAIIAFNVETGSLMVLNDICVIVVVVSIYCIREKKSEAGQSSPSISAAVFPCPTSSLPSGTSLPGKRHQTQTVKWHMATSILPMGQESLNGSRNRTSTSIPSTLKNMLAADESSARLRVRYAPSRQNEVHHKECITSPTCLVAFHVKCEGFHGILSFVLTQTSHSTGLYALTSRILSFRENSTH